MPALADLVNDLIARIPEDGSRITNEEIGAALEREAGEAISDEQLKEIKSQVVALGAAEAVQGPGGACERLGSTRLPAPPQPAIAPGTTAASVLTGELRNQIDRIWDAFLSGGIANPLEALEQLTYLLFIRRLDELETLEERRSQRSGQPMRRRTYPEGADEQGRPWSEVRWSRFKQLGEASAYATHMRDARFTIPAPGLLTRVVKLDGVLVQSDALHANRPFSSTSPSVAPTS
ncbi:type I restriction-modification system subunit M N-terminal domain-containing protein [Cyanobium sp. FGCU-6]|nr:type I restriction-modification system subunit M N-terminal domain-containing protein [Cyanobium sp. FGCU6]